MPCCPCNAISASLLRSNDHGQLLHKGKWWSIVEATLKGYIYITQSTSLALFYSVLPCVCTCKISMTWTEQNHVCYCGKVWCIENIMKRGISKWPKRGKQIKREKFPMIDIMREFFAMHLSGSSYVPLNNFRKAKRLKGEISVREEILSLFFLYSSATLNWKD